MRNRKEIIDFSRDDLEHIAKQMAKLRIIGDLFVGRIIDQEVIWRTDERLSVITTYVEGNLTEIGSVPAITSFPEEEEEEVTTPTRRKRKY
jgi:hypothetical protein